MSSSKPQDSAPSTFAGRPVVPEHLRDIIHIDATGRILIAAGREGDPRVRGFLQRCRYLTGEVRQDSLPYNELQDLIRQHSATATNGARDSDTIRLALEIQQHAVAMRASDIHIRVYSGRHTRVLMRIDGQLHEVTQYQMGAETGEDLCRTIYQSMARHARPTYVSTRGQPGQIDNPDYLASGLSALRVQTSPHKLGQMMVLRLFYIRSSETTGSVRERLWSAGYASDHIEMLRSMIERPKGLVLLSGETGSGKSTTLMHLLESIHQDRPGSNILTIEDPPEYDIRGALQMPVVTDDDSESRAEAFVTAIRTALRLDPDVLMIGEVRDPSSALLAVHAAITGHLTLSTTHTTSCIDSLVRLYSLLAGVKEGVVDPSMYLSNPETVAGLCYQTLVPLLCRECSEPLRGKQDLPSDVLERVDLSGLSEYPVRIRGPGCPACTTEGSSVRGIFSRTVVAETACVDAEYLARFARHDIQGAQRHWIEELGGRPILAHGMELVALGLVDPVTMEQRVGRVATLPREQWAPDRRGQ